MVFELFFFCVTVQTKNCRRKTVSKMQCNILRRQRRENYLKLSLNLSLCNLNVKKGWRFLPSRLTVSTDQLSSDQRIHDLVDARTFSKMWCNVLGLKLRYSSMQMCDDVISGENSQFLRHDTIVDDDQILSCGKTYITFHYSHFQIKTCETFWRQFLKLLTPAQAINMNFLKNTNGDVSITTGRPFFLEIREQRKDTYTMIGQLKWRIMLKAVSFLSSVSSIGIHLQISCVK